MQETYEVDCSSSRPHCPRTQWVSGIKMFRMSQAYGWHVASKPSYMQSGSGFNKLCRGDESIANYICLSLELEVQLMLLELGGRLTSAGTEENLHQCIHGMKHPHGFWFSPSYN